jgi:hypothetical protein
MSALSITVVRAPGVRFGKRFYLEAGKVCVDPYPMVGAVVLQEIAFDTLGELAQIIEAAGTAGAFLLTGRMTEEARAQSDACASRSGRIVKNDTGRVFCLDIDGLGDVTNVDEALALVGLADVSRLVQYSSSSGVEGKGDALKCHVFFLLDMPVHADVLGRFVKDLNLKTPAVRERMRLSRSGTALSWPFDPKPTESTQAIYVAPPILDGGVGCSLAESDRLRLVTGAREFLPAAMIEGARSASTIERDARELLGELRTAAGLCALKLRNVTEGEAQFAVAKVGTVEITGRRESEDFVYLNLNGGDSWGYFVNKAAPKYVRNFKGEPRMLTEEVAPALYAELRRAGAEAVVEAVREGKPARIAFLAREDGPRHQAWCVAQTHEGGGATIAPSDVFTDRQKFVLRMKELGLQEHGTTVELVFDPRPGAVKFEGGADSRLNTYAESSVMRAARLAKPAECPEVFRRLVNNVVGGDEGLTVWALNWLACVAQFRDRTRTALLLRGVPGSGKGTLCTVMEQVLGTDLCVRLTQNSFTGEHNGELRGKVFAFVDEVSQRALDDKARNAMMEALKQHITEGRVRVRAMRCDGVQAENFVSYMLATNAPNGILVRASDRRFTIGGYARAPWSPADFEATIAELGNIARYLMHCDADRAKAARIYVTEEAEAVRESNVDFLEGLMSEIADLSIMEDLGAGVGLQGGISREGARVALLRGLERGGEFAAGELFALAVWRGSSFRSSKSLGRALGPCLGATIAWKVRLLQGRSLYSPLTDMEVVAVEGAMKELRTG